MYLYITLANSRLELVYHSSRFYQAAHRIPSASEDATVREPLLQVAMIATHETQNGNKYTWTSSRLRCALDLPDGGFRLVREQFRRSAQLSARQHLGDVP